MLVNEIMTTPIAFVNADDSISSAARQMRERDVGAVPVASDEGITGIITDRDIAVRAVADGKDCRSTKVSEVMSPTLVHCKASAPLEDAERLMREKQIRRLLVTGDDGKAIGILALGDIARAEAYPRSGEVLAEVSVPLS